jgi:NAD(P)-dependent dehydrogenase (short-subunit alcohol dehydrogenase family)
MGAIPVAELLNLRGRVVLVTGGTSVIGPAIVRRFRDAGAEVAFTYHTRVDRAEQLARELGHSPGRSLAVPLDLRAPDGCESAVRFVLDRMARLDVLVNNAAIHPRADALDITDDAWDAMMDTNMRGTFFCAQAAARVFIEQARPACIVNIVTINAFNPLPGATHYSVSKAGVVMLTRSLAAEWGAHGIRVNAVAPGLIESARLSSSSPGWRERYAARAPLGRVGMPEDVANACLFLASPAASWITGQTLIVDGGVLSASAY